MQIIYLLQLSSSGLDVGFSMDTLYIYSVTAIIVWPGCGILYGYPVYSLICYSYHRLAWMWDSLWIPCIFILLQLSSSGLDVGFSMDTLYIHYSVTAIIVWLGCGILYGYPVYLFCYSYHRLTWMWDSLWIPCIFILLQLSSSDLDVGFSMDTLYIYSVTAIIVWLGCGILYGYPVYSLICYSYHRLAWMWDSLWIPCIFILLQLSSSGLDVGFSMDTLYIHYSVTAIIVWLGCGILYGYPVYSLFCYSYHRLTWMWDSLWIPCIFILLQLSSSDLDVGFSMDTLYIYSVTAIIVWPGCGILYGYPVYLFCYSYHRLTWMWDSLWIPCIFILLQLSSSDLDVGFSMDTLYIYSVTAIIVWPGCGILYGYPVYLFCYSYHRLTWMWDSLWIPCIFILLQLSSSGLDVGFSMDTLYIYSVTAIIVWLGCGIL